MWMVMMKVIFSKTGTTKAQYMRKHKIVPVLLNGLSYGLLNLNQ